MTKTEFFELCSRSLNQNGAGEFVCADTLEKLYGLCGIFLEENKVMNLTALREERQVIAYHFADCISAANLFPQGASVIDVGSGGGMPALPLAVVRPDLKITALDATAKKTAYIGRAAAALGLSSVSVITGRAEEVAHTSLRESFDCAVARAVAELRILLELCVPLVKVGGRFIALKSKQAEEELGCAADAIRSLSCNTEKKQRGELIDLDGQRCEREILVFEKTAPTGKIYPRKYANILKKPL